MRYGSQSIVADRLAMTLPLEKTTGTAALLAIFLGLSMSMIYQPRAAGQSATPSIENEAWPEADAYVQLPSDWRVLSWIGGEKAEGYAFGQWYVGAEIARQFKPILRPHWENINPDKERYLVLDAGYEYLRTAHAGELSHENRITFEMTPSLRPASKLLLRDRNRLELRWIDGNYSITYRNLVAAEVDLRVHDIQFTLFGTAEVFYDSPKHSWDQQWYTGGLQLPYKRVFMLETYYRREHCSTCTPGNWNAAGATLNFFFKNGR